MSIARKDLERLLFRSRELDSTKAAEVARGIFFNYRLRALGEELQRLSALVLSEADKREGLAPDIGYGGPTEVPQRREADSGQIGYTGLETQPPRPPGPRRKYVVKGFWWWDRFCQSKQEPQ
jgi:hypothetical protein